MSDRPETWFYHLTRTTADEAVPALLEKVLERGWRALVRSPDPARIARLDDLLWTYREDSVLPHGRADRDRPAQQPVLLTSDASAPNAANVLMLLDMAEPFDAPEVERVMVVFEDAAPGAKDAARRAWAEARSAGGRCVYFEQTESGGWTKKADTQA